MAKEKKKAVLINTCYGGFGLSYKCKLELARKKNGGNPVYLYLYEDRTEMYIRLTADEWSPSGSEFYIFSPEDIGADATREEIDGLDLLSWMLHGTVEIWRADPDLISVVNELGIRECDGRFAHLKIVYVPEDVNYTIEEYDGIETVHEVHRTWA